MNKLSEMRKKNEKKGSFSNYYLILSYSSSGIDGCDLNKMKVPGNSINSVIIIVSLCYMYTLQQ